MFFCAILLRFVVSSGPTPEGHTCVRRCKYAGCSIVWYRVLVCPIVLFLFVFSISLVPGTSKYVFLP